jgi:hypothetical protein
MQIDEAAFFEAIGGRAAAAVMSPEDQAEALDRYLIDSLNDPEYPTRLAAERGQTGGYRLETGGTATLRSGGGTLFGDGVHLTAVLPPMPERPQLLDFFRLRTSMPHVRHLLQSAEDARKAGGSETEIMACLLHDFGQSLVKVDHGWWCAQLVEPYVSEEVAFAIRYHQALRFFPDESVGYEYPELYNQIFGKDYVPEPYIHSAYEFARSHRWYMSARMVTVHDLYAFDPDAKVDIEPFVDIIARNFKQPAEGLGFDGSPVAHMWRSLIFPDHPL